MDNRRNAIIATAAAVVLCGCPGLFALLYGGISAVVSFIPGSQINFNGNHDPSTALGVGLGSMCVGIIFVAIAAGVAYFMLRKKPAA